MTTKHSESIEEVARLTREIDALAESNDWLAMHELVERRMVCLNRVFDAIADNGTGDLAKADCDKLAAIADSNERILRSAQERQQEIVAFANIQRAGSQARQAYAANTQ